MYDKILKKIREKVRNGLYIISRHAQEELVDENFSFEDLERSVYGGTIVRKQFDQLKRARYTISGEVLDGRCLRVVCRFSSDGDKIVIITCYEYEE